MTTPQDINAALDEISETLHTLLDRCPRQAYDDLGKIYQSAQSRVDDLRELQSHVAAHDVVDLEAIKRELRGVIFPYSAVEKVIDHLAARGSLRTTPEDGKGDGWQPIETAPRDKVFCVWMPFGTMYTQCRWREDRGCAENHFGLLPEATHWTIPHGPTTQQPEHEGE